MTPEDRESIIEALQNNRTGKLVMLDDAVAYEAAPAPDPFADLSVVATVFYGGQLYEAFGPKEGIPVDEFHRVAKVIKEKLASGEPLIVSDELRFREVAVRADSPSSATFKYAGTADAVAHLQKVDEHLGADYSKTACLAAEGVKLIDFTPNFDGKFLPPMTRAESNEIIGVATSATVSGEIQTAPGAIEKMANLLGVDSALGESYGGLVARNPDASIAWTAKTIGKNSDGLTLWERIWADGPTVKNNAAPTVSTGTTSVSWL